MLGDSRYRHLYNRKAALHLFDLQFLLKHDTPSCERVKVVKTSLRRNTELQPVSDLFASILLCGMSPLFVTRCNVL